MISRTYVNGVIAAKEKYFLGEKLLRCCETDGATALRTLKESGFGGGTEETGDVDFLIEAEENALNDFIRDYAGTEAEREYFLSPIDAHNVKAYFKASVSGGDVSKMRAPQGTIPLQTIEECFESNDFSALPRYLQIAVEEARAVCESGAAGNGRAVGVIFERALYGHLLKTCKSCGVLRRLLVRKIDLTNFVTAMRCATEEQLKEAFLSGGKHGTEDFSFVFEKDEEKAKSTAEKAGAKDLYSLYLQCLKSGVGAAEKALAETEIDYFEKKKYELSGSNVFLYYVLRKKTECFNVRIVFVCLGAGLKEHEIKKRLRGV